MQSKGNHQRSKRPRLKKPAHPGAATTRAIDVATGGRPSVPLNLDAAHKEEQRAKRIEKLSHSQAQLAVDRNVILLGVRKSLFQPTKCLKEAEKEPSESGDSSIVENEGGSEEESDDEAGDDVLDESGKRTESKWCSCRTCQVLLKYDTPLFHNFFKDLKQLFTVETGEDSSGKKYLELLPLSSSVKVVELSPSTNVFIAASDKDDLKSDFRNKPAALAKETLFKLYGREAFQTLNVTGKGLKKGTYTIPDEVQGAVVSFINRQVSREKRISLKKLAALINKRAPEWRRSSPKTPKFQAKKSKVTSSKELKSGKVVDKSSYKACDIGSPFKSPQKTPLKSPMKVRGKSPKKTPLKSSQKTPFKSPQKTPLKSPQMTTLKSPTKVCGKSPKKTPLKSRAIHSQNQEPPSFDTAMASLTAPNQYPHRDGGHDAGYYPAAPSLTPVSQGQGWGSNLGTVYHNFNEHDQFTGNPRIPWGYYTNPPYESYPPPQWS